MVKSNLNRYMISKHQLLNNLYKAIHIYDIFIQLHNMYHHIYIYYLKDVYVIQKHKYYNLLLKYRFHKEKHNFHKILLLFLFFQIDYLNIYMNDLLIYKYMNLYSLNNLLLMFNMWHKAINMHHR